MITNDCNYYSSENFKKLDTDNGITLFCINVQSLTAHWEGLYDLVCNMNQNDNKLDFIGLTEIFQVHDTVNYTIPGFHPIIYKTRTDNTRARGGVGLFINEQFQFKIREDISKFIPHVY